MAFSAEYEPPEVDYRTLVYLAGEVFFLRRFSSGLFLFSINGAHYLLIHLELVNNGQGEIK